MEGAAMQQLREALESLGRTSGEVDPDAKDERQTGLVFDWGGRRWGADSDTRIERLWDLARAMDSGSVVERVTGGGRRSLLDREGRPDKLYVYEIRVRR